MARTDLRIISLIPSATEIVAALGMADALVGRSHACDYPPSVTQLAVCTAPHLNPQGSSRQIHDRVTELLQAALSIYQLDLDTLAQLQPTHILTQAQCEVCAVSLAEVEAAVATWLDSQPQIISLQPHLLSEVWADMQRVGHALGVKAEPIIASFQARVEACQQETITLGDRPTVACIEWTDPLMAAGNWVPELVVLAGGENLFSEMGQHSPWLDWQTWVEADPEVIVLMPCGFNLAQTRQAAMELAQHSQWQTLRAVENHQVYLTDGNQYFNRPGPRLVDSLEILAEILHPGLFRWGYEGTGWQRLC